MQPAAQAIVREAAHVALAVGRGGKVVSGIVGVGRRKKCSEVFDDLCQVAKRVLYVVFDIAVRVGRGGRPFRVEVRGGADNVTGGEDALESVVGV